MEINHLDLFSGIGGFHLGFQRAGFKLNTYFSEVDKHAIAVYQYQFKNATYVGSVTDVRGADLPSIDLITFGSPCQDFSLAGKRKGMDGERSSLITEAIRLVDECRPRVFVWENVKGTFSSNNGADFWAIIQAFADLGGYRLEWQLLNTSWFLPQNRERIYLVGYSTTPRGDWGGVFPLGGGAGEDIKLSRQQANTNTIAARYGSDGQGSYIAERELHAQEIGDYRSDEGWRPRKDGNSPTLAARAREDGSGQPLLKVNPNYTYKALNKTIRKNPEAFKSGEVKAIDCYNQNVRDEVPCLTSPEHNTTRIYDGRAKAGRIIGRNPDNPKSRESGLPTEQMLEINENPAKTNCLTSVQKDNVVVEPNYTIGDIRYDEGGFRPRKNGIAPTVVGSSKQSGTPNCSILRDNNTYRIRRLTPIETERLQGFPDNHTKYGIYDGEVKEVSNTQRYKQCGNAVTVDVVQAVAERLIPIYNA